jgi:L-aspartate oxidase
MLHWKAMPPVEEKTDFVVVGAGVAGLRAAITLAASGRVLLLAKQEMSESATQYAQGGVAVALSDDDEISLHLQDTIAAGDGLVNEAAAQVLVEEGPVRIQELLGWGAQFDRSGGELAFTREAAHSRSRVLHAHGDSTGREIARALAARAKTLPNITFHEFEFTSELVSDGSSVSGVRLLARDGTSRTVKCAAVLLATGGAGQVFRDTTNPSVATGDGIAMAHHAGAAISDVEFVQFHPTALYLPNAPRFLLSEALRGEGALLLNHEGRRFMPEHHPMAELAPRDIVARAIDSEMRRSPAEQSFAFLDLRHLKNKDLAHRFPRIHQTCLHFGIDIAKDLIPVRPAAHYFMGGVRTDLHGRSSLKGLYAAGEAACTGVHGANRLASNSLLEGLVFGERAALAMTSEARESNGAPQADSKPAAHFEPGGTSAEDLARIVKNVMWRHAGVVRDRSGLYDALQIMETVRDRVPGATSRENCEARNLRHVAWLILRCALARDESRGAHCRSDFPQRDDERFRKHSVIRGETVTFEDWLSKD